MPFSVEYKTAILDNLVFASLCQCCLETGGITLTNPHYLGYLDATEEEEYRRFLQHAFTTTDSVLQAIRPEVVFICGRRGAGKSAIVRKLHRLVEHRGDVYENAPLPQNTIIILEHKDIEPALVQTIAHISSKGYHRATHEQSLRIMFNAFWSYVLRVLVLIAASNVKSEGPMTSQAYINGFLSNKPLDRNTAILTAIARLEDSLHSDDNLASAITQSTQFFQTQMNESGFTEACRHARDVFQKSSAVIAVETLERYDFDDLKIIPFQAMCRAVLDLHKGGRFPKCHLKCFVPAELSSMLFEEDEGKYEDFAVFLQWRHAELLEFLARRYIVFLKENGFTTESLELESAIKMREHEGTKITTEDWRTIFWSKFLPKIIRNRRGWVEDASAYLIRHTQKRPRELISCMNFILASSLKKQRKCQISEEEFVKGIHENYNLHGILTDNLSLYFKPDTFNLSPEALATKILINEKPIFSGKSLRKFIKRAFSSLITDDQPISAVEEMLLRSGLIGVGMELHEWIVPGENTKSRYLITRFEYCIPDRIVINERSICAVHPLLADRLNLRALAGIAVYHYHNEEDDDFLSAHQEVTRVDLEKLREELNLE